MVILVSFGLETLEHLVTKQQFELNNQPCHINQYYAVSRQNWALFKKIKYLIWISNFSQKVIENR